MCAAISSLIIVYISVDVSITSVLSLIILLLYWYLSVCLWLTMTACLIVFLSSRATCDDRALCLHMASIENKLLMPLKVCVLFRPNDVTWRVRLVERVC